MKVPVLEKNKKFIKVMETVLCFIFLLTGDEYEGSLFCSLSFMCMDVLSTCICAPHAYSA